MKIVSAERICKYQDALRALPPSGGGGCHAALLSVANIGHAVGLTPEQIFQDLRSHVHGTRPVSNREIQDAISKAFSAAPDWKPSTPPIPPDHRKVEKFLARVLSAGHLGNEADLWEASPVRLDGPPEDDGPLLLRTLYRPTDLLFIGYRKETGKDFVKPAAEWAELFEKGRPMAPHIMPNTLTGLQGMTKVGEPSYRCDDAVMTFKLATIEFDSKPRDWQLNFWNGALSVGVPVAAIIDSGNKSLHGWVYEGCQSREEWEIKVEGKVFPMMKHIGVDSSCRNEARLSRMPGFRREETGRWQRILYLNPKVMTHGNS